MTPTPSQARPTGTVTFLAIDDAVTGFVSVRAAVEEAREALAAGRRVGLTTGDARMVRGSYVAPAADEALELAGAAAPGQALLSATTARLLEDDPPPDVRLAPTGARVQLLLAGVAPAAPEPVRTEGVTGSAPLLEREGEVAAICAVVGAAAGGAGRLVAIEARSGMGKTRLLAEARSAAGAAGLEVLSARGGELEHEFAFGIVRQLFEPVLRRLDRAELFSGAAAHAAALFEPDGALPVEPEGSFAVLHGLYWLAANTALQRPTAILVDDVHWADTPSLRWLVFLARRLEGVPLLVVLATRPPEQAVDRGLVTELLAEPDATVIRPGALSIQATAALISRSLGAEPDEAFAAACHDATGGNPLLLVALLLTLRDEGVAPLEREAARVLEIGPEAVARAVALRLSRLPEEARRLASAAAVLGDRAELPVAAELAGLELDTAAHAATALGRADLLQLETPLEFAHPVVRAAVYEQTPLPERLAAHRRAAELLSTERREPEQAAAHLLVAPPAGDDGVVLTLRDAAARARRRGASETAVTYLRRALQEPPPGEARAAVLAELGLAERRVDLAPAAATLGEAVAAAADPVRGARLALELGRTLRRLDRERQALAVFDTAALALGDADPELRDVLGAEAIIAASFDPSLHAVVCARLGQPGDEWHGELGTAMQRAARRYHDARAGANRERMRELATPEVARLLVDGDAAPAGLYVVWAVVLAGDFEQAIEFSGVLLDEARRRGDLVLVTGALNFRALALWRAGELVAAEDDLRESFELASVPEVRQAHAGIYLRSFLANVLVDRGDLEGAQEQLGAVELSDRTVANVHSFFALFARARTALARGDAEGARQDLELLGRHLELNEIGNPGFLPWRSELALALLPLDRRDEAAALVSDELEAARAWGAPHVIGSTLRVAGLVAEGEDGVGVLREAVAELEGSGARLALARALVDLGSALRRAGKRNEARELLRRGLELAHRLGAGPLEEVAASELAATGARPRRILLSGADALTPSERRVAELAAEGLSNRDVAQTLYVTTKTVEVHLSNTYRKLGISSRGELAAALAG